MSVLRHERWLRVSTDRARVIYLVHVWIAEILRTIHGIALVSIYHSTMPQAQANPGV